MSRPSTPAPPHPAPAARKHQLNIIMVEALITLVTSGDAPYNPATYRALHRRGLVALVNGGTPVPTKAGEQLVETLAEAVHDDDSEEPTGQAELDLAKVDADSMVMEGVPDFVDDDSDDDYQPQITHSIPIPDLSGWRGSTPDPAADAPYFSAAANWSIALKRPSDGHQRIWAFVVGTREQAQSVADQWNLDRIDTIAEEPNAEFAAVDPAGRPDVVIHVFDFPHI
jgi:hypothetical protein